MMSTMLFLSGFFLSLLGSLPPGLISLSVAQTVVQHGLRAALVLGAGAAGAEFFQAWIAAEAAGWFVQHPAVEQGLRWAAVPVFLGLGLWLMLRPASVLRPSAEFAPDRSSLRLFAQGTLLSVFNLLAVPYWLAYCASLRSNGWWQEGWLSTMIFSAGVTVGTFAALTLYAGAAQWATEHSTLVAQYANRTVGAIFLGLGLWTLLKMWG